MIWKSRGKTREQTCTGQDTRISILARNLKKCLTHIQFLLLKKIYEFSNDGRTDRIFERKSEMSSRNVKDDGGYENRIFERGCQKNVGR